MNAALVELGLDLKRRLIVDQIAIDDRLAVAIRKHGRAKYLGGLRCWRGRQANFDRVKVIQHPPVFGDVVLETAKAQLGVGQLAIQQIAAVTLIDDDAVVLVHRRHGLAFFGQQDAPHHALHGGHMHGSRRVGCGLVDGHHPKRIGKGLQILHARVAKGIGGLLAQRRAIHQKQHPVEAARFE